MRPKNFPSTMSVIETGADMRNTMVWLRRSSATKRMASSGTANSSTTAAVAKVGAMTSSVTPGGLVIWTRRGWICRKSSRRLRKL
ncbi:hypothetical protein D3C83_87890 [compost metagenome]